MTYLHPFEALEVNARRWPNRLAVGSLRFGSESSNEFIEFTWAQFYERVLRYAQTLRQLGVKPQDRVALLGKNQGTWVAIDLAIMACGGISVPLYTQSIRSEVDYILKEADIRVFLTEEHVDSVDVRQLSFSALDEEAQKVRELNFRPSLLEPDETCTIIYTSGTTGEPKGVMHSARSIFSAFSHGNQIYHLSPKDRLMSYLPLSHVAERMLCEFGFLYSGTSVYFVDSVERMSKYLPRVRPTVFLAVPRIWDLMRHKLEREISQNEILHDRLAVIPAFIRNFILGFFVRQKLGFQKTRLFISGAAKLSAETAAVLNRYGIRITEAYGLTETLCISTMNRPGRETFGSVGLASPGVQLKIAEDGEICLKADFHFQGYYKKPELTAAAVQDGWFHSGDIGKIDSANRLFITDRKKDIFKTTNGKYVAPLPIETKLRSCPGIREVMVVGEDRPFCVAIASVEESLMDKQSLTRCLDEVNQDLPQHERIHSLGCIRKPWSVNDGQLTPTLKLKRKSVTQMYAAEINRLYSSRQKLEFFEIDTESKEGKSRAHSGL